MRPSSDIARLVQIMAALRTPGTGCPWDLKQDFSTIAPYTIEEAFEVADAIARGDRLDLRDELGDLLLQVVYHARLAEEQGSFAFPDVVEAITRKLIRRHPHVFGEARDLPPEAVKALWDQIKAQEKAERAAARAASGAEPATAGGSSVLDGLPGTLPALGQAMAIQKRVAKVGFDWPAIAPVLDKVGEELGEAAEAIAAGVADRVEDEIGDLLFAAVNLARHAGVDPEMALRRTNAKFSVRFRAVERTLAARGTSPAAATLDEMEAIWTAVKARPTGEP